MILRTRWIKSPRRMRRVPVARDLRPSAELASFKRGQGNLSLSNNLGPPFRVKHHARGCRSAALVQKQIKLGRQDVERLGFDFVSQSGADLPG